MDHDRSQIVAAARGDVPADVVVRRAQLVNVFTAEMYQADIGMKNGRFASIAPYTNGTPAFDIKGTKEIDAKNRYAMPGFFDAHVHIESTMVTPDMFARAVLSRGTTTVVIDPHELANVAGREGVQYMVEASRDLPVRILTTVPSCVPAVPGLEEGGASFSAQDISDLLDLPDTVGIAEIMDFPGVIGQNPRMKNIVETGLAKQVQNEGHAPRVTGRSLQAYLAAGVNSDHEGRSGAEILEKLRNGMMIYIRESSVSKFVDVAAQAWDVVPHATNIAMCTDDVEPFDMWQNGQMNRVIRRAVEEEIPVPLAVRFATLGGACRFGKRDLGAIAPGYEADLVLVDDIGSMHVSDVFVAGEQQVANGEIITDVPSPSTTSSFTDTVRLPPLSEADFQIHVPANLDKITLTTIEVVDSGLTKQGSVDVDVCDGVVSALPPDHVFVSITGRHGQNRKPFVGVLKNAGLKHGAYGTTVAHDSHNLIIAGTNAADMLLVARTLSQRGGGLCLAQDGEVADMVDLPIGGLMAAEPIEELGPKVKHFNETAANMGVKVGQRSPAMALSSLALTVTPEIRISDQGLVDVAKQTFLSLYDENH